MAVELVTGYAGKAHVSSGEDGARQAGTVGTGMYALMTVDEPLKAVLENANTVTVGPGDVLINGRHVQLTGSTTFAVPVGAQGMRTSNLLVLRYELAEDETESVTAITLTGEPSASDPDDPELATGSVLDGDSPVDMPLYRVVTTGIESAQPVKLFETVPPIAGLTLGGLPGSLTSDQLPVVPVSKGGTGATSAAAARTSLGLGALATLGSPLPIANGGTGATTSDAARRALKAPAVGGEAEDALLYCDYDYDQRVMTQVSGPGDRYMTVASDNSFGLYHNTAQVWVWQLWPDDATRGLLRAGRGNVSNLSRNTLYGLAPGTYLVANTATNGPESGQYGNLLVSYSGSNRVVALLSYDNGHVYVTHGSSSSGTFNWLRVSTLSSGYDVLWSGSAGSGGTIAVDLATIRRYHVVGVMTSYSSTFVIPALVYDGGSGIRIYGVGGYCSDSMGLLLQYFAIRQSGSSLVAYAGSQEVYESSVGGRRTISVTRIVGVC